MELNSRKRLWIMALLATLLSSTSIIQVNAQTLVLQHANGKTTDVELLTLPKVQFQNDKVLITSTVLNMEFPKDDVLNFTFKGKSTGINTPKGNLNYSKENGQIVFHGVNSSDKIAVYNAKGIQIPVKIQRSGDQATLSLSSIPSGVYLLNINGRTSKFTKK